ncbi:MAG: O-antigen ligase family protein [Desulforhopalus sp.]|nr:O-antigen ligase family protein [Desulforhopalus sp.]
MSRTSFTDFSFKAGLFFLYASCFFIPLATSFQSISTTAMVIFWLLSGEVKKFPALMRKYHILWPPILLLAMFAIAIFYSIGSWEDRLEFFKKYRELAFFPIVISLLLTAEIKSGNTKAVETAKLSFLCGSAALMVISYLMYFGLILSERTGYSTLHHITHSFFMALLSFWALQYALRPKGKIRPLLRGLLLGVFLLAAGNLLFISPGRTGMATLVVLMVVTLLQRLRPKQCAVATVLLAALCGGIYCTSAHVSTRVNQAIAEVKKYHPEDSRTSLGMRFDWWHNSVTLIKESPIIGYGTGSFRAAQLLVKNKWTKRTVNPHNEYLLIFVQLGIIGEALFLLMLCSLFAFSCKLPEEEKNLLQGAVVAFAWACLANSFLFDSHPSNFLMILSAVLVAARLPQEGKAEKQLFSPQRMLRNVKEGKNL